MQKNWYIIYIKPQLQKKLASFCKKKNLECYFVADKKVGRRGANPDDSTDPVIHCLFFVKATEEVLAAIKKIEAAFNIMYWQNKPATIREEEIVAIRQFTEHYNNIKVQKTFVDMDGEVKNMSVGVKGIEGNVYSISYKTIKLNLPSLGIAMLADVKRPTPQKNTFDFRSRPLHQQM